MAKIAKPASKQLVDPNTGHITQDWETQLGNTMTAVAGPFPLKPFTVATLPPAASFPSAVVHATDSGVPLFSDGTNWKKFDGTVVA